MAMDVTALEVIRGPVPARRDGYGDGDPRPDRTLDQAQAPVGPDLGERTLAGLLGGVFDLTHRQLSGLAPE
ncbi:hypothetical protein [Streptomyces sp. NPDC086777]|uniref:hypothetical protein n=1 Tax=Streptomyces sp. NPDC086777 TaxID=3154866 RepID=UPI003450CBA9